MDLLTNLPSENVYIIMSKLGHVFRIYLSRGNTTLYKWWHSYRTSFKPSAQMFKAGNMLGIYDNHMQQYKLYDIFESAPICEMTIKDVTKKIKQISIGGDSNKYHLTGGNSTNVIHILILTDQGVVLSQGNNMYASLGLGHSKYVNEFQNVAALLDVFITDIAAGKHMSAAISKEGAVYTWGFNSSGQLGHGEDTSTVISTPRMIKEFHCDGNAITPNDGDRFPILSSISFGCDFMILYSTSKGIAFGCGANKHGQIGVNKTDAYIMTPLEISFPQKIKKIVSGPYHSLALDVDNRVYSWGRSSHGRLGHGRDWLTARRERPLLTPKIIDFFADKLANDIHCGNFSSLVTVDNSLYTFGWCIFSKPCEITCQMPSAVNLLGSSWKNLEAVIIENMVITQDISGCIRPITGCSNWVLDANCS